MKNSFCLFICLILLLFSCDIGSVHSDLSGHSIYFNGGIKKRRIHSKNSVLYRTTVYGDVLDYDYNKEFIIIKQCPDKNNHISYLGNDLYSRYTTYKKYIEDTSILSKPEWKNFRGKIERDSLIYEIFKSKGATPENTSEDIRVRESIADSLIANDPFYKKIFSNDTNYWIIYNPTDSLIGPLIETEFEVTRKELRIPDKLKLD